MLFTLPPDDAHTPLYVRITRHLKQQIQSGALPAHAKLPSKRSLAGQLGVSVTTVESAYSQLVSEGFLESRPKRGFFVCAIEPLLPAARPAAEPAAKADSTAEPLVDFSPGGIDTRHFPYTVWRRLLRACFDEADATLLQNAPAQGLFSLRESIAQYLAQARGVRCQARQIVIGAGTEHLLQILSYMLDSRWTIALENPVYNKAYHMFSRMGHSVLPLYVDEKGLPVSPLGSLSHAAVYTTPSHQFPLGVSMPISRRVQLLNWAKSAPDRYIIEDDYDSEFRYDARPLPSLQSIDSHGRVIYLGTFSKSIAPSLRIGYMVLPEALLPLYQAQYAQFSCAVSRFDQQVLDAFLRQGAFETHLNRMRKLYKEKRRCLVSSLEACFGSRLPYQGEQAGHHVLVHLPGMADGGALCRAAAAAGVKVYPLSPYFIGPVPPAYQGHVLLGYGQLSQAQIQRGVALLSQAWAPFMA